MRDTIHQPEAQARAGIATAENHQNEPKYDRSDPPMQLHESCMPATIDYNPHEITAGSGHSPTEPNSAKNELNMTDSGIVAHQSAIKDGELLKIPQFTL